MTSMSAPSAIFRPALLAAVVAIAAALGGCAAGSDREAYFESRSAVVSAQPGTGVARLALWPSAAWGRSTVALADRRTTSDVAPTLPLPDSTR